MINFYCSLFLSILDFQKLKVDSNPEHEKDDIK